MSVKQSPWCYVCKQPLGELHLDSCIFINEIEETNHDFYLTDGESDIALEEIEEMAVAIFGPGVLPLFPQKESET